MSCIFPVYPEKPQIDAKILQKAAKNKSGYTYIQQFPEPLCATFEFELDHLILRKAMDHIRVIRHNPDRLIPAGSIYKNKSPGTGNLRDLNI